MSILVTGASGFIGYYVTKELMNKHENDELVLLHRSNTVSEEIRDLGIRIVQGNLQDKESLAKALDGVDTVYHVAAETRENMSAETYNKTNVQGTGNLLEAFIKTGGKKFLHTSAVGVYGYSLPNYPISEDYPKNASFPYHRSKLLSENLVFQKAEEFGFFVSAVRPPMVMGPRDPHVAPGIFSLITKGKTIPLINGGTQTKTSFVHVKDVARALVACGNTELTNKQAFNVVSFACTQKDLFDKAGEICGIRPKYLRIRYGLAYTLGLFSELTAKLKHNENPKITRRRVNQVGRSRLYDTNKIQKTIGFEPKYTLETSLIQSFHWLKTKSLL